MYYLLTRKSISNKTRRVARISLNAKSKEETRKTAQTEFREDRRLISARISRKGVQLSEVCWIARGTNYLFNGGLPTFLEGSGSGRKDGVVPGGGRGEEEEEGNPLKKEEHVQRGVGLCPGVTTPHCLPEDVCYKAVQVTNRCTS